MVKAFLWLMLLGSVAYLCALLMYPADAVNTAIVTAAGRAIPELPAWDARGNVLILYIIEVAILLFVVLAILAAAGTVFLIIVNCTYNLSIIAYHHAYAYPAAAALAVIPIIALAASINWAVAYAILMLAGFASAIAWRFYMHIQEVAGAFDMTEAELNDMISGFRSHGSRLSHVKERKSWYDDFGKKDPVPGGLFMSQYTDPYPRTISEELIEKNEADLQKKHRKRGMAMDTAFLYALVCRASPAMARDKIAESNMYVSVGISHLVKEDWRMLKRVAKWYGYPKHLVMRKEDGNFWRNWEVLDRCTKET
jgi:hypothetical protein